MARFVLHYLFLVIMLVNVKDLNDKTAFLNFILNEYLFVTQPDGFLKSVVEAHVYLTHNESNRLKYSLRLWHKHLELIQKSLSFMPTWADPALYIFENDRNLVMMFEILDEVLTTGNNISQANDIVTKIMESLGFGRWIILITFLGTVIEKSSGIVKLHNIRLTKIMFKLF